MAHPWQSRAAAVAGGPADAGRGAQRARPSPATGGAAESPRAVAGGTPASAPPTSGAFVDLSFDVKNLQGSLSVRF